MGLFKKSAASNGAAVPANEVSGTTDSVHAAPMPRWHYGLRALQFILALLTLGLAAYAEHVHRRTGELSDTPYIMAIIVAALTVLIFLPLALLHQKRPWDARGAFASDLLPTLLWLATLVTLASYTRIYSDAHEEASNDDDARQIRRAWKSSAAATAFAGLEFLLFLLTTLMFLRYWHLHRLNHAGPPNYAVEHGNAARGASPAAATRGPYGGNTGADPAAAGYEMHPYNRGMADPHTAGATRSNIGGDGAGSDEPTTLNQDVPDSLQSDGHSGLSKGKGDY